MGRNAALVVFDDEIEPRLVNFRKKAKHPMPVPGDLVTVNVLDEEHTVIENVLPRTFALERRTLGGQIKMMAANVDTIAITAALIDPPVHLAMVDRLTAFAVQHDLTSTILLTKADLAGMPAAETVAA